MKKRFVILSGIFICVVSCRETGQVPAQVPGQGSRHVLWYDHPAERWEEALPVGNGRLGAMIYGGTGKELLQLNEETIWAGEPGNNIPGGFREVLPEVRRLVFDGKFREAEELAMTRIPRNPPSDNNYGMAYQPAGNLRITFPGHNMATDYRRELDIGNAVAKVTYAIDQVTYSREYLATAADQVIMIRLTAGKKGMISCSMTLDSPHEKWKTRVVQGVLVLDGVSGDQDNKRGRVRFRIRVLPLANGGTVTEAGDSLMVSGADAVTLLVSIGTNFNNYRDITGDAGRRADSVLMAVAGKDPAEIRAAHVRDYREYFDRVSLDLGVTDSVRNTTDRRVVDFAHGNDPQLAALYFQFGRYLLISSSRPGSQPANLQGIWNDRVSPPWDSKYTININTEMNYWPAELTALPEMHWPLIGMVKDLAVTGRDAAGEMYGARGWVVHHNTDLWRITGPVDGASYGLWPMGGAWLSQHLWQHYLYGGDREFLTEIYPVLKGVAMFYMDVLQREPEHDWLVVNPSMSPENTHPGGARMAAGTTMDNQLVFDVFSNLVDASGILDWDHAFADSVSRLREMLAPMQIGRFGQLQEWMADWDRADDRHRHVSHLYGLYPGNQVSPWSHPGLFRAARNSLEYRGDESTGWSMGWKVNLWARLLDGNRAHKLITDQLSPAPLEGWGQHGGTYPNLFDAHPPFQIDGNFGCTAGIAEMLIQSHDGAIFLLPALPDAWPVGRVRGLRARGGFTVDFSWREMQVEDVTVHSSLGGNCRLRLPNEVVCKETVLQPVEPGEKNSNPYYRQPRIKDPLNHATVELPSPGLPQTVLVDLATEAGKTYHLNRKQELKPQ